MDALSVICPTSGNLNKEVTQLGAGTTSVDVNKEFESDRTEQHQVRETTAPVERGDQEPML
jgi:hypothetical protein